MLEQDAQHAAQRFGRAPQQLVADGEGAQILRPEGQLAQATDRDGVKSIRLFFKKPGASSYTSRAFVQDGDGTLHLRARRKGESHGAVGFVDGDHPCSDACGDHSAGGSEQTSHKHQGQDDCQGSTCDFGRSANEWEAQSCHVFCQAAAVLPSEVLPVLTGVHLEHDVCATGVLPPVRLHLVYQVLLI